MPLLILSSFKFLAVKKILPSGGLLLGRQSSLNRGQSHDTLMPGPEIRILGLRDKRRSLVLEDPGDEVVPGEEGNIDVGTIFC